MFEEIETKYTWRDKIRDKFEDVKHFPALVWEYIYSLVFGSIKVWGSILLLIIMYILWSSNSFTAIYYSIKLSHESSKIERVEGYIEMQSKVLEDAKEYRSCMKNQVLRLAENKQVEVGFCKK